MKKKLIQDIKEIIIKMEGYDYNGKEIIKGNGLLFINRELLIKKLKGGKK